MAFYRKLMCHRGRGLSLYFTATACAGPLVRYLTDCEPNHAQTMLATSSLNVGYITSSTALTKTVKVVHFADFLTKLHPQYLVTHIYSPSSLFSRGVYIPSVTMSDVYTIWDTQVRENAYGETAGL